MLERFLVKLALSDPFHADEPSPNLVFGTFLDRLNRLERQMHELTAPPPIDAQWDDYFMGLARYIATKSKDRSRKVGCVIVGPGKEIRATGYNGFPRGVNDDVEERHQRPAKYRWTEHAERNAVYNAARAGVSTMGCTAYLPWYPCMDCARALVQCGVVELVAVEPDWHDPQFAADFAEVSALLQEAGVALRFVAGEAPKQKHPQGALPPPEGTP